MNKSGIAIKLLGVAVLPFLMAACSPTSENSLLTSEANQPSEHNVDMTPTTDELYVKVDAATAYALSASRVDISGECFTSTYPRHAIYVYNGNTQLTITDIAYTAGAANTGYCYQGRYNISINIGGMGTGSYGLKVKVVGIDDKGQVYENPSRGLASFTLNK